VSEYVSNPLLIRGLKFDLRIYVAIASVNPLRLYIYDEGLVRFATDKYDMSDHKNIYSHLTNYSINKNNKDRFVPNCDPDNDCTGSKWSLTAFKRYLSEIKYNENRTEWDLDGLYQ
jgi:hypothetical protein